MFNLVNFETKERFDNFPYTVACTNIGVGCEFYPDFECDTFAAFYRFQVPFNDDYILGKTEDVEVSDKAYKGLLKHYELNYLD